MTNREQLLLIAAIRVAYAQDTHSVDYKLGVQFTAESIAQAMTKANKAFDSVKFLSLCGITMVN